MSSDTPSPDDSEASPTKRSPALFAREGVLGQMGTPIGSWPEQLRQPIAAGWLEQAREPITAGLIAQVREVMAPGWVEQLRQPIAAGWLEQAREPITAGLISQVREAFGNGPLTSEALGGIRLDLLEELTQDLHEVSEEIGRNTDEATLEEISGIPTSGSDPLLEACVSCMARFGAWAQQRLPELSARAAEGANKLAAATLYTFLLVQLPAILLTHFGPLGFVLGLLLSGQAEVMSDEKKGRLGPVNRGAIDVPCPTCAAVSGMWCVTVKGSAPGSRAKNLHKGRLITPRSSKGG